VEIEMEMERECERDKRGKLYELLRCTRHRKGDRRDQDESTSPAVDKMV
jgi:hypothetical protein